MDTRITVVRPSLPPIEEYISEIQSLWDNRILANMGEKHREFEALLSEYAGGACVSLLVNGHSALECALEVMELEGEVITTPFTFSSTTHAIVRRGLTPVFADICLEDFNIDPACIESLVGPRTCAIVPVHVYGNPCDADAIQAIADKHGLKVIYDAAHAFGSMYRGRPACTLGDMSMVSLNATKVMHSVEGGALFYHDAELARRIDLWKNFGQAGPADVEYPGCNAKLNEFSAAMGICNLRHVDDLIAQRKQLCGVYRELLAGIEGIRVATPLEGSSGNGAYFPILVGEDYPLSRDGLMALLDSRGIGTRWYFYPLTSDFACYQGRFDSSQTPRAVYAAARVLTLPLYSDLLESDVERICAIIRNAR